MSTGQQLIKARLGMLALAEELQNISAACKKAGISRSHYYAIKEAFEKYEPKAWPLASAVGRACRIRHHRNWRSAFSR